MKKIITADLLAAGGNHLSAQFIRTSLSHKHQLLTGMQHSIQQVLITPYMPSTVCCLQSVMETGRTESPFQGSLNIPTILKKESVMNPSHSANRFKSQILHAWPDASLKEFELLVWLSLFRKRQNAGSVVEVIHDDGVLHAHLFSPLLAH
jgi:hypothetical protein